MLEGGNRLVFWHCENSVSEAQGHDDMRQKQIRGQTPIVSIFHIFHISAHNAHYITTLPIFPSYHLLMSLVGSHTLSPPLIATAQFASHLGLAQLYSRNT